MASESAFCCLSNRTATLLLLYYFLTGNLWSLLNILANLDDSIYWKTIEKNIFMCYADIFITLISAVVFLAAIIYISNNTPSISLLTTAIVVLLWGMIYSIIMFCSDVETKNRQHLKNQIKTVMKDRFSEDHMFLAIVCPVLVKFYSVLVFLRYMMEVKTNRINKPSARINVNNEEANYLPSPPNNVLPSAPLYSPPVSLPPSPYINKSLKYFVQPSPFSNRATQYSPPPPPYDEQAPRYSLSSPSYQEQAPQYSIEPPPFSQLPQYCIE